MNKKSQTNEIKNVVQVNKKRKQSSFFKFFCPCLCSKSSDKEQTKAGNDSFKREQFYQQQTQNQQNYHQQTQSNLPIGGLVFQIQKQKNLEQKTQNPHSQVNPIRQDDINFKKKTIKFNVKRNSNLQGYLQKNKQQTIQKKDQILSKQKKVLSSSNEKQRYCSQTLKQQNFPMELSKNQKQLQNGNSMNKKTNFILQKINNRKQNINLQQLISIEKHLQKMQNTADYQFLQNFEQSYETRYPINQLKQNKLMIIGDKSGKLLTKITSVKLYPYPSAIERYKQSMKNKKLNKKYAKQQKQQTNFNSQLDKYWDKRYFLFQKFDQGIKLDQQSWYSVTPQTVADYISSKVNVKETILDAFCGAGGDSIKLSTSCRQVISNDIDQVKIKCLLNNLKIYDVDNVSVSCSDFFKLDMKVDAVYLAPPWGGPEYYKLQSFNPQSFQPKLSQIIQKALSLSNNLFFLLPANTDVEALSSIMCDKIRKHKNFIPETCSFKLEKIYFNGRLKFVAGFFGNSEVQNDIKLNQELSFIYDMLKQDDQGIFKHKKLVRKLRQLHGMVNLLNYIFQCQYYVFQDKLDKNTYFAGQEISMIQKFQKYIVLKGLINEKTLQKIKQQQQIQYEYELKNRQQKNKKQKNKKIQKHKEKQMKQRQLSLNLQQNHLNQDQHHKRINNFVNCQNQQENQNEDIPIETIVRQTDRHHQQIQKRYKNEHLQTISSNISSQIGIQQNQPSVKRDSLRTVSIISQFQEDQLNNIMNERIRTNSDISFYDSIHQIHKGPELDISIQQSGDNYFLQKNKMLHSLERGKATIRHSQPPFYSPRQNITMKKNKLISIWEKGIVQEANQDKQKDN